MGLVADSGNIEFSRIRVLRDVFYFQDQSQVVNLGKNEYFVLGDNPPISTDSRTFGPVEYANFLGKIEVTNNSKPFEQ